MRRRWRLRIRLAGAVLVVLAAAWILVSGGDPRELKVPGSPTDRSSTFYTDDHYASFAQIKEGQ